MNRTMVGVWNRVTIYCMNHEEPKQMNILKNTEVIKTPFYSCQEAYSLDNSPNIICPNRLNLDDYQGLVLKFLEVVASSSNPCDDFTNYRFSYKGTRQKINVKVLVYNDDEIRLGIINTTVLGK